MLHQKAEIVKIDDEGSRVKTFYLDFDMEAEPGQFVMTWIPGVGEKPFCIAGIKPLRLSIAKVGPFSEKMHQLKKGDFVWVRGPFGRGFSLKGKKAIFIGGGYGVAPLRFLEEKARRNGMKAVFIMGAKTCSELMKPPKAKKLIVCTDDGSKGEKGVVTEHFKKAMKKSKPDCVYACGPERMLVAVRDICEKENVECQLSLERFMKCGFGLCGQCSLGGLMVCKDGPVFTGKELKGIVDFGKNRLDADGKKIGI